MIEEWLIADLRGDEALAATVGRASDKPGRPARPSIDWIVRPDSAAMPGISLQRAGTDRQQSHDGPVRLVGVRLQADCWAATQAAARRAYAALKTRMESGKRDSWRSITLDDNDGAVTDLPGGTRAFRVTGDFMIWYKED